MRLIKADELMELYDGLEDRGLVIPIDVVIQNIKDMPTAYDTDKVVEQIQNIKKAEKECRWECENYDWDYGCCEGECDDYIKNKAIEIVKKGGVNEK